MRGDAVRGPVRIEPETGRPVRAMDLPLFLFPVRDLRPLQERPETSPEKDASGVGGRIRRIL